MSDQEAKEPAHSDETLNKKHPRDDDEQSANTSNDGPDKKRKQSLDDSAKDADSSSDSISDEEDENPEPKATDQAPKASEKVPALSSLFARTITTAAPTFGLSLKTTIKPGGFGGAASGFGSFGGGFKVAGTTASTAPSNGFASLAQKNTSDFQWGAAKPSVASGDKTQAEKDRAKEAAGKLPKLNPEYKAESGEETEKLVISANAKLYCFVKGEGGKNAWQERGAGVLHLNDLNDEHGVASSRIVMRQNLSKRLILNGPIWKGLKLEKLTDKNLTFTAINYAPSEDGDKAKGPQVFLLKLGEKDASALFKAMDTRLQTLLSQEEKSHATAAPTLSTSTVAKEEVKEGESAAAEISKTATNETL